jgi:AraC-like DNA-binding protein
MGRDPKSQIYPPEGKAVDHDDGGIVRLATLLPIPSLLRDHGVDSTKLLADVGLSSSAFADADNRIPFRTAGALLQRCAEATGCIHFGLLVGQRSDVETLGRVGALMRQSPTVDAALRSLILHLHLQNRGGVPTRMIDGDQAVLGYVVYQRDMLGTAQVHDLVAALSYNMLRSLCGRGWRPSAVTFSHARPDDVRPYSRFFKAALHFDADATELRFERRWLDRPLPGSDAALYKLLLNSMTVESKQFNDLVEQVRIALRMMIPTGRASELLVADLLGVPSRTLRRQLVARGSSFRKIAKETRYEISRQLLTDTRMAIVEVAAVLEYADASAFTRAFRRWTQMSPAAWRARASIDAAAPAKLDSRPA